MQCNPLRTTKPKETKKMRKTRNERVATGERKKTEKTKNKRHRNLARATHGPWGKGPKESRIGKQKTIQLSNS